MGLKSLVLLNKNASVLFFNNSFLTHFNFNRLIFFFFFISKLFLNFFNAFFFFTILFNLKRLNYLKQKLELNKNYFFIGKINLLLYQK